MKPRFEVGDRVQASRTGVGAGYEGLIGTVVGVKPPPSADPQTRYLVKFDNPPERDSYRSDYHGGYWNEKTLESVATPEDIEAAIQSIMGGQ